MAKEMDREKKSVNYIDSIRLARQSCRKRNFSQTFDLIVNLKSIDLKKPENRWNIEVQLPEGRGKEPRMAFFGDNIIEEAKALGYTSFTKTEIEKLAGNKKEIKRLAKEHDIFLAETTLMPLIGKTLGTVLGPRNKLPKPIPPKVRLQPFIEAARKSVRVSLKETPVIQVPVASESMADEQILKNLDAVYAAVRDRLPKGRQNIRNMLLKLTMGRPVRLEVK